MAAKEVEQSCFKVRNDRTYYSWIWGREEKKYVRWWWLVGEEHFLGRLGVSYQQFYFDLDLDLSTLVSFKYCNRQWDV